MAKAKKLPSGSWRCLVYDHTEEIAQKDGTKKKKRIYESFTADTRKEAEYLAAEFALKKNSRDSACKLTYKEALNKYIQEREAILSPATVREYKRSGNRDLIALHDIRLCDMTQDIVQAAINQEALSHSPKSVRNMHGLLSAVLNAYRPDFILKTDLPKRVRPKIYVPSDDEIQQLMTYVKGDIMEIPILLAAFGPMRRGEICALDSDHVSGTIVHVEYAMVLNSQKKWVIKRPKSYAGDRFIDFPQFVIDKLKSRDGRIVDLHPSQISDRFTDILKKAGLPHFRFHDLRHYCASIQHALGIPDVYIMQRGGWGNDGVLKSVYRHAMESQSATANSVANRHFESIMQHEMQHENKNP